MAKQPVHTELALWLHQMASLIGTEQFKTPPVNVVLVLEGEKETHEVLWKNSGEPMTRTRIKNCGHAVIRKANTAKNAKSGPTLKLFG